MPPASTLDRGGDRGRRSEPRLQPARIVLANRRPPILPSIPTRRGGRSPANPLATCAQCSWPLRGSCAGRPDSSVNCQPAQLGRPRTLLQRCIACVRRETPRVCPVRAALESRLQVRVLTKRQPAAVETARSPREERGDRADRLTACSAPSAAQARRSSGASRISHPHRPHESQLTPTLQPSTPTLCRRHVAAPYQFTHTPAHQRPGMPPSKRLFSADLPAPRGQPLNSPVTTSAIPSASVGLTNRSPAAQLSRGGTRFSPRRIDRAIN